VYEITGEGKYYIKFPKSNPEVVFNEVLANKIYKVLDVSVPEAKAVLIKEGSQYVEPKIAYASKMVSLSDRQDYNELKNGLSDGFIADAFLANWDIARGDNSLIAEDGELYRVDNGGALLFRAQGSEKGEAFSEKVVELETFFDKSLRSGFVGYDGVTSEQIASQVEKLKERITDDVLEGLVGGVFPNGESKQYLIDLLKKRRDYIIEYYKDKGIV